MVDMRVVAKIWSIVAAIHGGGGGTGGCDVAFWNRHGHRIDQVEWMHRLYTGQFETDGTFWRTPVQQRELADYLARNRDGAIAQIIRAERDFTSTTPGS